MDIEVQMIRTDIFGRIQFPPNLLCWEPFPSLRYQGLFTQSYCVQVGREWMVPTLVHYSKKLVVSLSVGYAESAQRVATPAYVLESIRCGNCL